MRHLTCAIVLFFGSLGTLPLSAQTRTTIVPVDWLPALAPSIRSALEQLKEADSQAEMNRLSREVAEMTDAQLFIAYVRLYQKLGAKKRATLLSEQNKWLKAREKAARDGVESEGGSLAPLEANNAEVTLSEKRLAELRARLKSVGAEEE
ncbi:MAG TPA: lysozyme inhibitor LprI family protein [Chthoniobacterales bacterium]|nr:lysozyme inhibitor LprI family protein [Chthoniobacterales bacterium]